MRGIKFKAYEWKGKGLDLSDPSSSDLIYKIDATRMRIPGPSYLAPRIGYSNKQSFLSKLKTRLSHAWYALKGGECE